MARVALKVIESQPYYEREVELWPSDGSKEAHSLHYSISYPESIRPELPAYFIDKYSAKGDVVLDPFCGSGATALEANLRGRIAFAADVSPLALRICASRLTGADITDVTLRLQQMNLRRPVDLKHFEETFSAFYDVDTYRELVNLKSALASKHDDVSIFIELIALSLLHGHSAGYFSVYSLPQISVKPEDQQLLNIKRRQIPDYRAVMPRILRKTASALRDGIPSIMHHAASKNRVAICDARNLHFVPTSSVDLVVTSPPLPGNRPYLSELWLKLWFSGISGRSFENNVFQGVSLSTWADFMNESLVELARVTRAGGRAVLELAEVNIAGKSVELDDHLSDVIREHLSRYWETEGVVVPTERKVALKDSLRPREGARGKQSKVLILRRR